MMKTISIGFALLCLVLLGHSPNTLAHSYLANVEPPMGTLFQETPESIALIFTQGPDTSLSEYVLEDVEGKPLKTFEPVYEGEGNFRVILNFDEPLPSGNYRVAWKAVSTTDGHTTRGIVPLSIGVAPETGGAALGLQAQAGSPSPVRMIVRWMIFFSMAILVGSLMFPLIVPKPLGVDVQSEKPLLMGSVVLLIVAGFGDVLIQSQEVGTSIVKILLESQWGLYQLTKYIFAVAIGLLVFSGLEGHFSRLAAQGLAALMLVSQALASHNSNIGLMGTISDWAHLMAASLWLGGLAQLAWIWIPRGLKRSDEERLALTQHLIPRFSQLALVSVILILASGIYTALYHVPSWDGLFNSIYGRALLAKGLLLIPILLMAAVNRFGLMPKLEQASGQVQSTLSRLRRVVAVEALVIVAVLFFAATMTTASPPHGPDHSGHGETTQYELPLVLTREVEDMILQVQINPLEGENGDQRVLTAQVMDLERNPLDTVLRVSFAFEYLGEDLGDTFFQVVSEKINDGESYRLEGGYLILPGSWDMKIIVRIRQRLNDLEVSFPLEVSTQGRVHLPQAEETEQDEDASDINEDDG